MIILWLLYYLLVIGLFALGGYEYDGYSHSRGCHVVIGAGYGFAFATFSTVVALLYVYG